MEQEPTTTESGHTWSSPNAKLLSNYRKDTAPLPTTLDFPLKSSLRAQAYHPPPASSLSPEHPTPNSLLKYNTQLNSRNPNTASIRLKKPTIEPPPPTTRSFLHTNGNTHTSTSASTHTSTSTSTSSTIKTHIPHRIIRTPRSFLIKRRGSLTPLMNSFPRLDSDQDSTTSDQDQDRLHIPGPPLENLVHKRKVRFDREVFCLEFDQLPEELPLSRQKRFKLHPANDASSSTQQRLDFDENPQQRNLRGRFSRSASIIQSSTRPLRHSPRLLPMQLPISPEYTPTYDTHDHHPIDESDQEIKDSTATCSSAPSNSLLTTVDISSLSLNPSDTKAEPSPTQVNKSNDKLGRTRVKPNNDSNSNEKSVEGKENDREHGSMKPKQKFLLSWMGRQRASSLPFDLYCGSKVDPVDELETKLNGLSISLDSDDTHHKEKEEKPERLVRSSSLPNLTSWFLGPGHNKNNQLSRQEDETTRFMPSFPGLASFDFAPKLQGVKQMFIDHQPNYLNKINSTIQDFFYNTALASSIGSSTNFNHLLSSFESVDGLDYRSIAPNQPIEDREEETIMANGPTEKPTGPTREKNRVEAKGRKSQAANIKHEKPNSQKSSPTTSKKRQPGPNDGVKKNTDPACRPLTRSFLASHLRLSSSNSSSLSLASDLSLTTPTRPRRKVASKS